MANAGWADQFERIEDAARERRAKLREFEDRVDEENEGQGRIVAAQVYAGTTIPQMAEKGDLSALGDIARGYNGKEPNPETGEYEFPVASETQEAANQPVEALDPEGESEGEQEGLLPGHEHPNPKREEEGL